MKYLKLVILFTFYSCVSTNDIGVISVDSVDVGLEGSSKRDWQNALGSIRDEPDIIHLEKLFTLYVTRFLNFF